MSTHPMFAFTSRKFFTILTVLYGIFLVLSSAIIYFASLQLHTEEVKQVISRMKEGIRYKNGVWDMSYLNADPQLPSTHSHYIITTDGYVIERWRPINGFLNTSDMNYLLRFTTIQTVTAPTQEKWRVLSYQIKNNGKTEGVLTVSRHISDEDNLNSIDTKLAFERDFILKRIKISDNVIDISHLDIIQTQYDISIKIVDKYNNVLIKTNNSNSIDRTPNYIDRSYVATELSKKEVRTIRDEHSGAPFIIVHSPVLNENNEPVGIIVVGKSLADLQNLLIIYISTQLVFFTVLIPFVWILHKRTIKKPTIHSLSFLFDKCLIEINNETVEVPEDTNQCHLCELLFKNPQQSYTVEEIARQCNYRDGNHWRKVYDAMLQVNKRVEPLLHDKLIVVRDKQFGLNTKYLDRIRK